MACGTLLCCCCWLITFTCCRSAGSIATSVCCLCLSLSLSHVAAAHVRSLRNPTYLPGVFKRSPRQRRRAQAMCAKSEKSTKSQTVKGSSNKLAAATANGQHRWQQQVWLCQAAQPTNSPPSARVAASSSNSSVFPYCPCLSPSLDLLCFAVFFSPRTACRMRNVGVIAN